MQLAVEIYIYIYLARHRRQGTSDKAQAKSTGEKFHKKGTGESTGEARHKRLVSR